MITKFLNYLLVAIFVSSLVDIHYSVVSANDPFAVDSIDFGEYEATSWEAFRLREKSDVSQVFIDGYLEIVKHKLKDGEHYFEAKIYENIEAFREHQPFRFFRISEQIFTHIKPEHLDQLSIERSTVWIRLYGIVKSTPISISGSALGNFATVQRLETRMINDETVTFRSVDRLSDLRGRPINLREGERKRGQAKTRDTSNKNGNAKEIKSPRHRSGKD